MTLTIKVSHVSGDVYAACVKQPNKPDVVISKGQEHEFVLWDSADTSLTIGEVSLPTLSETCVTHEVTQADVDNLNAAAEGQQAYLAAQTEGENNNG